MEEPGGGEDTNIIIVEPEGVPGGKGHRHRARKSKLYSDIRTQMEFYFSDANLTKQRVMRDMVQATEYLALDVFVEKFNKLGQLTKKADDVRRALKKSEMLQLSEDGSGVKRKIPFDQKNTKDEATVENCTIYVENIPLHVDHTWVEKIFIEFGPVAYVSLPKFKRSKQPKGFAFVEFEEEDAAKRCLEAFGEMGACLPTNIEPSALMSITTFNEVEEPVELQRTSSRKRKHVKEAVQEEEAVLAGKKPKALKVDDHEAIDPPAATTSTASKSEKIEPAVVAKDSEAPPAEAISEMEASDTVPKKKKRRQKHKETFLGEEKLESDLIHLKILPKRNWRQLRNRYLNLQRENYGKLKAQLRNAHAAKPTPSFTPKQTASGQYKSVCVKIQVATPESRETLVATVTSKVTPPDWSNFVKYIDYEDNGSEAIVRLDGGPMAGSAIHEFMSTANRFYTNARIMSDTETDEYWALSKAKLKAQKKSKTRGKERLLNRVSKLATSHIHFDNNEMAEDESKAE